MRLQSCKVLMCTLWSITGLQMSKELFFCYYDYNFRLSSCICSRIINQLVSWVRRWMIYFLLCTNMLNLWRQATTQRCAGSWKSTPRHYFIEEVLAEVSISLLQNLPGLLYSLTHLIQCINMSAPPSLSKQPEEFKAWGYLETETSCVVTRTTAPEDTRK